MNGSKRHNQLIMNFQMLFIGIITIMICPSVRTEDDGLPLAPAAQRGFDWMNTIRMSECSRLNDSSHSGYNSSVLVTLLGQLGWRSIIVIYDKSNEYLLQAVTKQLANGIVLVMHEMKDHNDNTSFLEFLLDVHQRLFPQLDFVLLTGDVTMWNILTYVNSVDSLSNRTTDFNYHSKWLVCLKSGRIDKSIHRLDRLQNVAFINTVCNVEIMTLVHHNETTSLLGLSSTHYTNSILFPALKYGYSRRKLIVSTVSVSTFIQTKTINNITHYSGFCIYLLDALADSLNFTYELMEPTHGTWGILVNGSWDGLTGQMERREADLALADLTINIDRSVVMDFLLPSFYYDYMDIIYKEENQMASMWLMLLRPFSPIVFLCIAVCTGWFFFVYSAAMVLIRDRCVASNEPKSLSDVFWYTISCLLKQGTSINPSSHGIRVLVSAWALFVVIIVAEYSANLTAAFTVRPAIKPFENLQQLLDNTNYKLGMLPGTIMTMTLQNSDIKEYHEAWLKIVKASRDDPDVFNINETKQLEKIKGGNYAFILNEAAVRRYMTENCGLQSLGIHLDWQPVTFGVPKHSTLKLDFEQTMRRLESSGIFAYWWQLHQSNLKRPACPSRQRSLTSRISLDDIKSGFVLLGVGITAALLVLAVEMFKNRFSLHFLTHGRSFVPR